MSLFELRAVQNRAGKGPRKRVDDLVRLLLQLGSLCSGPFYWH